MARSELGADEAGFRAFVASRSAALHRVAYLLTGDQYLAEDLLQTALLETAIRWRRITAVGDPEPYVRRVLYTRHVSWWRRTRHEPPPLAQPDDHPQAPADGDPDVLAEQAAGRLTVAQALARLTPRQRAVLVLRYFEDLTEVQAGSVLGCSPGTIKSQTRDALRRLRQVAPELADLAGRPAASAAPSPTMPEVPR